MDRHGARVVEAVGEAEAGREEEFVWVGEAAGCAVLAGDYDAVGEVVRDRAGWGERLVGAVDDEASATWVMAGACDAI